VLLTFQEHLGRVAGAQGRVWVAGAKITAHSVLRERETILRQCTGDTTVPRGQRSAQASAHLEFALKEHLQPGTFYDSLSSSTKLSYTVKL
jgi:hypothetical protein